MRMLGEVSVQRNWGWGKVGVVLMALLLTACGTSGKVNDGKAPSANTPVANIPLVSNTSVMAEGKLVPVQDAALSFSTSGVVGEILVSEGDSVQTGQPLMRLTGGERLKSAAASASLEVLNAQQALDTLKASANVAQAQALLNLAEAQKALDKAKDRVYSKDYQRGDQEQIDIARANYILTEDAVKKAGEQYDRLKDRDQDDPVRAEGFSQLAAARQKRDTAQANLNYLLEKPNDLDVNEVNAKLAVAQANVDEAIRQVTLKKNGPDVDQLALAQTRLSNAQVAFEAAQAGLADLELKAPFAGSVSAINISKGEFTAPGVAVVRLADFSTWEVETTDLTEVNVARIQVGQPAMINFDALPGLGIIGRVTKIKSYGEDRQGDVVYSVVLKLEHGDAGLRWNMTASVTFLEKGVGQ